MRSHRLRVGKAGIGISHIGEGRLRRPLRAVVGGGIIGVFQMKLLLTVVLPAQPNARVWKGPYMIWWPLGVDFWRIERL